MDNSEAVQGGTGRDGIGWGGTRWDGVRWDGVGWDGRGANDGMQRRDAKVQGREREKSFPER